MPAPDSIISLIERFERNRDDYHAGRYNETQVRREFIDPLFVALGWDVHNRAGYAEAYKDVIHEDAIKIGGATKAPDYCFRIGGARKFFLEAKKPAVDIAGEPGPAYQLRRYAWSAKLPLSVLTDFEEFAVYDCRIRPKPTDKASTARTMYIRSDEYADRWDEIASIFSKEAVLQGSFDKYAAGRKKRGTAEVDAEFLREIENWRDALARNIALRNPQLTGRELNFAVQRTIDRIIFLRICEDRGVETYGSLQALINGTGIYTRLMQMFRAADDRYNSGLFHFNTERDRAASPDTLTPAISIDDKALKDIFASLYYPQSPYEFAVLPADILGNVYEQFLGKVIHLTAGHRARVEDKPEVKKAGGVYYTPKYIVDYIVEHTVGKLLGKRLTTEGTESTEKLKKSKKDISSNTSATSVSSVVNAVSSASSNISVPSVSSVVNAFSKTPRQVSRLRILDPACGSGSFLVGAYRKLLEYHRDWYLSDGPEKHTKKIYQGAGGQWFLTTAEKKRILLNNIYGVDIDPQAVEVTKLNLLLCALENENQNTLGQLALIRQRALPDLSSNIKCGNSLIGPDFYEGQQMSLFDEDARYKINAFDWPAEFPEIFKGKNPGFDAVIGNPPYIQLSMSAYYDGNVNAYLSERFSSSMGRLNTFGLFFERVLSDLLATKGRLSFIVPNTILTQESYQQLREQILTNRLEIIAAYKYPVFNKAVVETVVLVIEKVEPCANLVSIVVWDNHLGECRKHEIEQELYCLTHKNAFLVKVDKEKIELQRRIDAAGPLLKDIANINQAIALKHDRSLSLFTKGVAKNYKRVLDGRDIQRYRIHWPGVYLAYDVEKIHSCKRIDIFEAKEKIFFRRVSDRLIATLDEEEFYALNTLVVITFKEKIEVSLKYVLGLLNSRLLNFYYVTYLKSTKKVFSEIQARQIGQLPIRAVNVSKPTDSEYHDRMVSLVEAMLSLHKQLAVARAEHDKTLIQRQIDFTDGQIDKLVYELYGLTAEEIAIIEGAE